MQYKNFQILKYKSGTRAGELYIVDPNGWQSRISIVSIDVAKRVIDTYLTANLDMYQIGEKDIVMPEELLVKPAAIYSNKNWAA